jgi:hypothetical protein
VISALADANSIIVESGAVLTLMADDTLRINGATQDGISNQGEVQIHGVLNVGDESTVGNFGIRNEGLFFLQTGGEVNINNCVVGGVENVNGATFTIYSNMNVGTADTVGVTGILNEGAFNHLGGELAIDQSTSRGIHNLSDGVFTNSATISIGNTFPIGTHAVENEGQFDNNTDATINLANYSIGGFLHSMGHFTNQGLLNSTLPSAGQFVFESSSLTDMDDGGEIKINE